MADAVIKIERLPGPRDRARAYDVLVDGISTATISSGASRTIRVQPGRHILALKLSWTYSKELSFCIGPGEQQQFVCRSGVRLLTGFFDPIIHRHDYIHLVPESQAREIAELEGDNTPLRMLLFTVGALILAPMTAVVVGVETHASTPVGGSIIAAVVFGWLVTIVRIRLPSDDHSKDR